MHRLPPKAPAAAYQTFQAKRGAGNGDSHCAAVGCQVWQYGQLTTVDEATELGKRQAAYIRTGTRRFTEERGGDGLTRFSFPPGTTCFGGHKIEYTRRGGDWRGNPQRTGMRYDRADQWVDDWATHQDKLAKQQGG